MWHQEDLGNQGFFNKIYNNSLNKTISIHLKLLGIPQCHGKLGLHKNIKTNLHKVGEDMVMESTILTNLPSIIAAKISTAIFIPTISTIHAISATEFCISIVHAISAAEFSTTTNTTTIVTTTFKLA